jgi:protein SCO1/2
MVIRFAFRQFLLIVLLAAVFRQGYAQPLKGQTDAGAAGPGNVVYRGGMVSPPLPKPKFTLTDTSGVPFDFATKTKGYLTLLFFGFTNCPDMCPMQMHMIAQALKKVPPAAGNQIKVVFVTTDPDRDSPKVLRAYLDHFSKSFIGLTGDAAAIDAAQIAANVSPAKKSPARADGTYDVGHAAFVIAYTKDNLAHVLYPMGMKEEDLAHDLPYLANETWVRPTP